MIIVSHKYKYIFVHIGKNAGTSIVELFLPHEDHYFMKQNFRRLCMRVRSEYQTLTFYKSGETSKTFGFSLLRGHATAKELRALLPHDIFQNFLKFAVIRNPWDRCVSRYTYNSRFRGDKDLPFSAFLELDKDNIAQSRYILDDHGNQLVDHVLRFENLHDDLKVIIESLSLPVRSEDLPHSNASWDRKGYREYYKDEKLIEIVADHAAKDIERFGYAF